VENAKSGPEEIRDGEQIAYQIFLHNTEMLLRRSKDIVFPRKLEVFQ
jgi:hypothetical protein